MKGGIPSPRNELAMLPLLICGLQNLLSEIGHEINGWPLDHRKLEDEVSSFMSKAAQTGIVMLRA